MRCCRVRGFERASGQEVAREGFAFGTRAFPPAGTIAWGSKPASLAGGTTRIGSAPTRSAKGGDRLQAAAEIGQIGGEFRGGVGGHVDQRRLDRAHGGTFSMRYLSVALLRSGRYRAEDAACQLVRRSARARACRRDSDRPCATTGFGRRIRCGRSRRSRHQGGGAARRASGTAPRACRPGLARTRARNRRPGIASPSFQATIWPTDNHCLERNTRRARFAEHDQRHSDRRRSRRTRVGSSGIARGTRGRSAKMTGLGEIGTPTPRRSPRQRPAPIKQAPHKKQPAGNHRPSHSPAPRPIEQAAEDRAPIKLAASTDAVRDLQSDQERRSPSD